MTKGWPQDGSAWTIEHAGRALNGLSPLSGADLVGFALYAIVEMVDRYGMTSAGVGEVIEASDHDVPSQVAARLSQLKKRGLATSRQVEGQLYWRLTPKGRDMYSFGIPPPPSPAVERVILEERVRAHLTTVVDPQAREYLEEVALAIGAGARRVAVVALWSAATYEFGKRIERVGFDKFNDALRNRYGDSKRYKNFAAKQREDLQDVKEEHLLLLLRDLQILGKGVKDVFERDYLNLRNKCGHPSDYRPSMKTVEAMLDDLIANVFTERD